MSEPPFNPRVIQCTVGVLGIVIAITAIYSLYSYLAYSTGIVIGVGMKCAAPNIPLSEIFACVVTVISINFIIGYLFVNQSPFYLITGDVIIPLICVFGFGIRWVYKGWMPAYANRW